MAVSIRLNGFTSQGLAALISTECGKDFFAILRRRWGCINVAYNMDCLEGLANMQDDSVDLTVTSPPYDDIRTYKGFEFDWHETIKQMYRVIKPGGVCVWIVSDQTKDGSETGTSFKQALYAIDCGFNLHDTMIWEKESFSFPEDLRYYQTFEYMFIWSKGKPKTFNPIEDRVTVSGGIKVHGTKRLMNGETIQNKKVIVCNDIGRRFNVWKINAEKHNITGHPAVFPIKIAEDHIRTWSNAGDLVLDPFLGSGTTRLAAYNLGRDFIGFEIAKEYFDNEEERFNKHTQQENLFLNLGL